TNHLDIPSREALEEALDAYDGTIITISHDRYFLDRVATQILALDGCGHAEHYEGDYTEYHDWKAERRAAASAPKADRERDAASKPATRADAAGTRDARADAKAQDAKKSRGGKDSKKKGARSRDSQSVEAEIAEVEKHLAALGDEMSTPEAARDASRLARLNDEYAKTEERLRGLYEEWERAAAEAASA
nr:ABC transporter ATP-binding protein [Acidobacteriota bacterium]